MEKEKKFDSQPLDPKSDRYRICPYLDCHQPFMTTHRSRDFCSQKCHDAYHNERKRLLKLGEEVQPTNKAVLLQGVPKREEDIDAIDKNISILGKLALDSDGSFFDISELLSAGFDFKAFTFRYKLPNTEDSFFMLYGSYQIYLTEPNTILIHSKKQQNELF